MAHHCVTFCKTEATSSKHQHKSLWRQRKFFRIFLQQLLSRKRCYLLVSVLSFLNSFISSPEPSGSQGKLIVYPYSGVRCRCHRRRQQCLNIFSSETALPIKAKFYVEPLWEGGTKVCINGPGHMTKVAAMPIYGKNLGKSSSPEPEVLWSWNLACSIGDSSSTKFV